MEKLTKQLADKILAEYVEVSQGVHYCRWCLAEDIEEDNIEIIDIPCDFDCIVLIAQEIRDGTTRTSNKDS